MDLSYVLNHLAEQRADYYGAVAPPVIQTSNFAAPAVAGMRAMLADEYRRPLYTRGMNPTARILNEKLAALDEAEAALCFSSGVAAISAAVLSQVQAGDHVLYIRQAYGWTRQLMQQWLPKFGVDTEEVDGRSWANFEARLKPNTRLIMLESPTSFFMELQPVAEIAREARRRSIITVLDNTYAGPLNPSPLSWGVDFVAYSGTKYHNGHSDVVCGVLSGAATEMERIFHEVYLLLGQIIAPMDAWLILRGLRTLPLRMQQIAHTTPRLVEWLSQQPQIAQVLYPFHPSHPQHALALQQMQQPAGLFSVYCHTQDPARIEAFADQLQRFTLAVSWGGHESLVLPAIALFDPTLPDPPLPLNLIRFYIGLESLDCLQDDLAQALPLLSE
ncbi:MAG: trans-sulfuration enzyme family protein [Sphingobacteriia bacterium]|jgi:cystathionine beta-lyase/cystathionine gamma-synthase